MKLKVSIALLMLACSLPMSAFAAEAVMANEATRFVGKEAMVCGKVEKARYVQNTQDTPTFLHMGGVFPRHTFSVRIPAHLRDQFKPTPEQLEGKDVCVTGLVKKEASRAEIEIGAVSHLKLATIK